MKEKILIVEDQFVEASYLRQMLVTAGYTVTGIAYSVIQAQEMIAREKPDFVLLDIFLKGKQTGIDLATELAEKNIPFIYLSANSNEDILNKAKATQPYGFLVKPFREKDLLVTLEIARYRHDNVPGNIKRENMLKNKLSVIINSDASWERKLADITIAFQPYLPFQFATAGFNRISSNQCKATGLLRINFDEYQHIGIRELQTITGLSISELSELSEKMERQEQPGIYAGSRFEKAAAKRSFNQLFADLYQLQSFVLLPIPLANGTYFDIYFYSARADGFTADHLGLLNRVKELLAASIQKILDKEEASGENMQVTERSAVSPAGFEGIVGRSPLLLHVFDLITQVAGVDTSVLILGESGTGKERIADSIHQLSPRKNKPFVKINCAALPATLIESELFGHEKGAFTGAIEKRMGKFEKADKGTIFLDEIGEMPAELQAKLLRVLQEKYIERIGSKEPTKVDVRVIAATNRNLEKEVAEGRFRLDLYYRLNVFPIVLPPLRDRADDIPELAHHFMHYYNRKAGKKISGFTDRVLKNMDAYQWPGNIRELENLIERAVLLTKGTIIEDIALPASVKKDNSGSTPDNVMKTIDENERDYIVAVLKKCHGRIWGAGGAAEILNVPPTTLTSKMKKLGIKKGAFE